MRLTCPACGAAYDVPDDAIPTAGREVECSDCGAVWQAGRRSGAAVGAAPAGDRFAGDRFAVERALARAVATGTSAPVPPPAAGAGVDLPEDAAAEEEESAPPIPGFDPPPKRRPLDDSIESHRPE